MELERKGNNFVRNDLLNENGESLSGAFSSVLDTGVGDGGSIDITVGSLSVTGGGRISASTSGEGDAGNLQITATDSIEVSGTSADNQFVSQLTVEAAPNSIGSGGNLRVNARELNVNGGQISAATASGEGGNITLQIDDTITLSNNSLISAEATGDANGGNIDIDTTFIIARPNGDNDIIASAGQQGTGGRITIDAESVFGIQERTQSDRTNDIDASGGVDGEVIINTPNIDITQGLVQTPENVVEPEQTTAQACQTDRLAGVSSGLTIEGKGGIPPEPGLPLDSRNIIVSGQTNPQSTIPAPIETAQGKIQPARGVIVTESGEIILTAYRTNNPGERIPQGSLNCDRT